MSSGASKTAVFTPFLTWTGRQAEGETAVSHPRARLYQQLDGGRNGRFVVGM
ncbi:MAG: hypothetical protein R3C62_25005 [Chloroflexota bacterium]